MTHRINKKVRYLLRRQKALLLLASWPQWLTSLPASHKQRNEMTQQMKCACPKAISGDSLQAELETLNQPFYIAMGA